jgi:uncharacterized membrane protein
MPPELIVFFTAMTPYVEMKLAVPLGMELGLSTTTIFLFGVAGTIIPGALLLALLPLIVSRLRKISQKVDTFFTKLFEKTRKDHSKKFEQYGAFFLIIIIAIPLPGSGTVSAAIAAFIFGIDYGKALSYICIGAILAGLGLMAGITSFFKILDLFT